TEKQIKDIFSQYLEIIEFIEETKEQVKKSISIWEREFKHISKNDVLHAILAKDNNAILVSRDWHFEELRDLVEIKKPEDIT
ncbi:MAG: PIN domain-containing protein, partial [Candidatus Diapherotrites archaeon]|nr:PIN domain-containing protein [Candidatus Diapherotrites archaeon]